MKRFGPKAASQLSLGEDRVGEAILPETVARYLRAPEILALPKQALGFVPYLHYGPC